jgi:hypothetical protein
MSAPTTACAARVIDEHREYELHINWNAYSLSVLEPLLRIARQADWSAQLSPTPPPAGLQLGNAHHATDTPTGKLSNVFEHGLLALELDAEGSFEAYEQVVKPFVNGFHALRSDMAWIEMPSDTNLDWLAVSAFVRNNASASEAVTLNRADNFITKDSFVELGQVNGQRVYAIKFIKDQYVDPVSNARRLDSHLLPTLGTFGYVTLQNDGFQDNTRADIRALPLCAVKNIEFREIAGSAIYLEFVVRFFASQEVGTDGADHIGSSILVSTEALPHIDPFFIPHEAYEAWHAAVGTNRNSRLRLTTLDENEAVGLATDVAADPTLATALNIDPTAVSAANAAALAVLPAPTAPTAKLGGSTVAFLVAATVATVVGIIALIVLLVRVMATRRPGAASFIDTTSYPGSALGGIPGLEVF